MDEGLETVAHVDLQRYLGTWYEIARKPMRFEDATARDITATYALEADGAVRVTNSCLDAEGEVDVAEGRAEPVDAGNNATLEVTFLPRGLRWMNAAPRHYPEAAMLRARFEAAGLRSEFTPLYGDTPFNNWRVVAWRE